MLSNLNAAFRELQMTLKPGRNEPWADVRVRQAVNFAINRQQIIQNVYSGEAAYTSYVPPGYGPWPLTEAAAEAEVREVRPADGEEADGGRRRCRRASRST